MRTLIALALLGLASHVAADVYRWTDASGVVHYADKPLVPEAKPATLPTLQTYKAGTTPPMSGDAVPAPAAAPSAAVVAITSPAADETIRDSEGNFTVNVAARMGNGQGLVFYLDGAALNSTPTQSSAYQYSGVERGEHSVGVALVNAEGAELGRAEPVTVHVKPPTVGMSKQKH